jgi:hypothetical protein
VSMVRGPLVASRRSVPPDGVHGHLQPRRRADQLVWLLTGNDDYMAIAGRSLIECELVSGTTDYVVTTGYGGGTAGAFTNDAR